MKIAKKQIAFNRTPKPRQIKYIVIHDTGNRSKGANAMSHFNYFNGADRGSSADFFVDDSQILQVNDYNKYYTWHCGDGKGKYGITNENSIGIEICINSDGDYNLAFAKAVELTKHLANELNIAAERVVRHYDASRKNCPASMNANNWKLWKIFKNKISETEETQMAETIYNWTTACPQWSQPYVQKALDLGIIKGDEHGNLNLNDTKIWCLVVTLRATGVMK